MSSTIGVCPDCGKIGAHAFLPEETVKMLFGIITHARLNPDVWSSRAYWCPHCKAVYLTVWNSGMTEQARLDLLAPPSEPLAIADSPKTDAPPVEVVDVWLPPAEPADSAGKDIAQGDMIAKSKPRKGDRKS